MVKFKFKYIREEYLRHKLNEALRDCLDCEHIRIKSELDLDLTLEYDYNQLLDKFESHLKKVIIANKNIKKVV